MFRADTVTTQDPYTPPYTSSIEHVLREERAAPVPGPRGMRRPRGTGGTGRRSSVPTMVSHPREAKSSRPIPTTLGASRTARSPSRHRGQHPHRRQASRCPDP